MAQRAVDLLFRVLRYHASENGRTLPQSPRKWQEELENGYLRDFQVYFQATRLRNYPLFPTGRFKKGLATEKQLRPVTKDGLRGWFQEYEQRLGIPHVSGRGWYGVRRTASDLAEDSVKDARALNLLTGHRGSQTRRGYQDPEHDEVRLGGP